VIRGAWRAVRGVALGALLIAAGLVEAAPRADAAFEWRLPRGFPEPAVPADNPMSVAKVALGERLFADTRLSVTGSYSCARCHDPARAFTDGLPRSRGATGAGLSLNAPTLINAAYSASFGWHDTGITTFETQMRGPLFNEHPPELGLAGRAGDVERVWSADAAARAAFAAAFPGDTTPVTLDNAIRAIAAYERTLLSASSPFDRYVFSGDHAALTDEQKRGMDIFFSDRGGCARCHGGINFAGEWVDREHPAARAVFADTGTGEAVRVPTLRNLAATAPYMHDGRFATLEAVLDHYERLAADPAADPRLRRASLTTDERAALREFLGSLADSR
jgi:cytochrome c peroxidase